MDRNGKVVGGCIAVDLWTKEGIDSADYYNADPSIEKNSGSRIRLFFLSHLHADHTVGLNSSWCNGPIYTSPMNAKLAPKLLPNFRTAEKLLVPLELEVEHLIPLGDSKDDPKIRVTLIDANHVPGAVMFIFRGYFGNVLYTGDFRYSEEMFENTTLRQLELWEDMDELYLDNTYFFSKCTFGNRSEVVEKLISFLKHYDAHHIYIGARRLGKEDAFVKIALALKEKICVDKDRLLIFRELEMPDVFTTDPEQARIFVVQQNMITKNFLSAENMKRPTIGVWLTALFYNWDDSPFENCEVYDLNIFEYSDHCSHPEIIKFVERLKPKKVIPIVGPSKSKNGWLARRIDFDKERNDMTSLRPYLSSLPLKSFGYNKPIISGLPQTLGSANKYASIRREVNEKFGKPPPKRVYRGPKGPVYDSSTTTTTCNKSVVYNELASRKKCDTYSSLSKENVEGILGQLSAKENIIQSVDNSNIDHTSDPYYNSSHVKMPIPPKDSEISIFGQDISCNESNLNSNLDNKTCLSMIESTHNSYLKVMKISENNEEQICYVNTTPKHKENTPVPLAMKTDVESYGLKKNENLSKKSKLSGGATSCNSFEGSSIPYNDDSQNLNKSSDILLPSILSSDTPNNQIIDVSKNICASANSLLSKTFRRGIEKNNCSILHTIDQNLSEVEDILNKK